jgi:hypothetical protein
VLWFERQVVGALMHPGLDAETRAAVESYVAGTLRSMPEHLRAEPIMDRAARRALRP